MSYYLIPKTSLFTYKHIDCLLTDDLPKPIISNSLSTYLYEIKHKLNDCEREWDIYKKYTNPYEYIHTLLPHSKKCVSKYKPLSRSFFKMIELINTTNIKFDSKPIRTFHLAEGPGGFIEAMCKMRMCPEDSYVGMTLLDNTNDYAIPAWKKTDFFLNQNKNVKIEIGADKTGNILSLDNFMHCKQLYEGSMDLITADGGFDFSVDFNNQEIHITKLLFAQMCYAIILQKKGGSFILKTFDCFMQHSIDIMYILSSFYEKVYITKPNTSRIGNSEKYIVCKGFIHNNNATFFQHIYNAFEKMLSSNLYVNRFINISIPYYFLTKMEEYNAIFGQQQIENIYFTISLINNKNQDETINKLIKLNIQKCVQWCSKYNIEYHSGLLTNNVFLN